MNKSISDSRGILLIPLMAMFANPIAPSNIEFNYGKSSNISLEENIDFFSYETIGITFADKSDLTSQLISFASRFIASQKQMDKDALRILEENLWDLV